ncbi:glycosyltransferase family 39 protein [Breoghania sp. L-A4]|uniref:glycosyltransferase family 39 protein n=1 Tax=Breoghania sp. L-A4 TaxID=2304600 RepID=UPI000E35EF51|nr:glycosyltransferase family 39 protein [Breoghania sp. L-A4]AXS39420.1 glycosyl transferase family 39 [Breoghania sp. L-A4]
MTGRDPQGVQPMPIWLRPGALVLFVLALTLARLLAGGFSGLSEDEAYYRLWGLNPAWGYFDHPPMVGWWVALGHLVAGDTALGTRLIGILAAAFGSLAIWRTASLLYGARAAGWAVLFFNATFLIGIGSLITTPDAPSVLFWGLTLWALAEFLHSDNANWWLAVGFFAGLGLISKYSVLFLGVGIVLWLVWVPQARRSFATWQLWAGGLVAVLICLPVVWWNAAYEWASFVKQFGRAVPHGWTFKYIFEFIGAEIGLLNPLVAIPALVGFGCAAKRTALRREPVASLLLLTTAPFLAYLVVHAFHARVQANWPAPLLPAAVLVAAGMAAGVDAPRSVIGRIIRICRNAAVPVGVGLSLVFYVHAVWPLSGAAARKDPSFQIRGWEDIASQLVTLGTENNASWVATTSYGMTGQLAFALRHNNLPVVSLTERIRYVMAPEPDPALLRKPALYVSVARRDASLTLRDRFADVTPLTVLVRRVRGVALEEIRVYRVEGAAASPLDPLFPVFAN